MATPKKNKSDTYRKVRERTVTRNGKNYQYYTVDLGKVDGKRKFRNFTSLDLAEAFI